MITAIAKTIIGKEFLYSRCTAHCVSKRNAKKICKILNDVKYKLKENECWFIYELSPYDRAYDYAITQKFILSKNGNLKERK